MAEEIEDDILEHPKNFYRADSHRGGPEQIKMRLIQLQVIQAATRGDIARPSGDQPRQQLTADRFDERIWPIAERLELA